MKENGKMIEEAVFIEAFSSVKKLRERLIEEKKKVLKKYFEEEGEVNGQLLRRYASTYRFWSYLNWALWKAEARLTAEEDLRRGKKVKAAAFHLKYLIPQDPWDWTELINGKNEEEMFAKVATLCREIAIVAGKRKWVKEEENPVYLTYVSEEEKQYYRWKAFLEYL
jgi:hypothetical protein